MASSTDKNDNVKAPSSNTFKFAAIQMQGSADKIVNLEAAFNLIQQATSKGAQLVSLPECFNSPYGTKYFAEYCEVLEEDALEIEKKAASLPNIKPNVSFPYDLYRPTYQMLSAAAAKCGVYVVGGSYPEKDAKGQLFNTAVVFDPEGNRIATHRKVHLFDIDVPGRIRFKESEALTAGSQVTSFKFEAAKTKTFKPVEDVTDVSCQVGVAICYDLRFPELAQIMAQQLGCKLLVYPGAFNMTTGPAHWAMLQQGRALDNQVYVATISPSRDPGSGYIAYGHSMVVNPWGTILGELEDKPDILVADIDLDYLKEVRTSIPVLTQKRNDLYSLTHHKQ